MLFLVRIVLPLSSSPPFLSLSLKVFLSCFTLCFSLSLTVGSCTSSPVPWWCGTLPKQTAQNDSLQSAHHSADSLPHRVRESGGRGGRWREGGREEGGRREGEREVGRKKQREKGIEKCQPQTTSWRRRGLIDARFELRRGVAAPADIFGPTYHTGVSIISLFSAYHGTTAGGFNALESYCMQHDERERDGLAADSHAPAQPARQD